MSTSVKERRRVLRRVAPGLPRLRFKGLTLIELLVALLILSILTAVALPLYFSYLDEAERKVCRANMRMIASAIQSARVRDRANDYSPYLGRVEDNLDVITDLQTVPNCPSARSDGRGTWHGNGNSFGRNKDWYTVDANAGLFSVRCRANNGHGVYRFGIDRD